MKSWNSILCCSVALAATLAVGWQQGRLTNRFARRADTQNAADQLRAPLPTQVGKWKLVREDQFAPEVIKVLQCPAHISRQYEHEQTGDLIAVFVIIGPHGPVSVHTPDICYSSRDFKVVGPQRKTAVQVASGAAHEFWELPLKANNSQSTPFRVLYAWSAGTVWEAAKYPRFSYGGLPHLYKLQLSLTSQPGPSAGGFDPAQDFLSQFLPQLQPRLVAAQRPTGSSS